MFRLALWALLGLAALHGAQAAPTSVCYVEISKSSLAPAGTPLPLGIIEVTIERFNSNNYEFEPATITTATSSSTWTDAYYGPLPATNAIDGNYNDYTGMAATAAGDANPWIRVYYQCVAGVAYAGKVVVTNRMSRPRCEQCQYRLKEWYSLKSFDENGQLLIGDKQSASGRRLSLLSGEIPFSLFGDPSRDQQRYVIFPGNQCLGTIELAGSGGPQAQVSTAGPIINLMEVYLDNGSPASIAGVDWQVTLSTQWQPSTKYGAASLTDHNKATFGATGLNDPSPKLYLSIPCTEKILGFFNNRPDTGTGYCEGGCANRITAFDYVRYAVRTQPLALQEDSADRTVFDTAKNTYALKLAPPANIA